jgi:C_GCAxxG_C_C family probable redox protein
VLAVGEHLLGPLADQVRKMSSSLAGGVGSSQQELCGALSGGALIIGALYGRTLPDQDDEECASLVSTYREGFLAEFGTTRCADLRASGFGSEGQWPCSTLVERAATMLLELLNANRSHL